ncbi:MAG: PAS domain S-box protein [Desulfobulbaceae bacterium]|nr:PAS domain S-box protein [Desulfobulbaceae bacterium]
MNPTRFNWSRLGINRKFNLAFAVLFSFMLLTSATAYLSFLSIHRAEENISKSTEIGQHVLEMDRGMERARRLLNDFFIHYQRIGLQKAHEQYAQPSIRQIARVVLISSDLRNNLSHAAVRNRSSLNEIDVNLYLASAKRFADTSIQAVELISKRAAPGRGLEAQIQRLGLKLKKIIKKDHLLRDLQLQASSYYKEYLLKRQRSLMQSVFNTNAILRDAAAQDATLPDKQKNKIFNLIDSCRVLTEELLAVDLKISEKMRDFSLQEQTVTPVSNALVEATRTEVELARHRIDNVYRLAGLVILIIALLGMLAMLGIARILHNTITKNILQLTESARAFGQGNMAARARESSEDELGQLARIFNIMAAHVQDLVDNLEHKVAQRTAELTESENRFRLLVGNLPKIAVLGYDHQRNIVYWNRTCEELYGYSEEEALGRKLEDLIIPEHMQEEVRRAIGNWYENNVPIPSSEVTHRHRGGSPVPAYSSHVMLVNSRGEKTMFCVNVDLADLKQAQAMERKSESFYRSLFDHSSSGVAVYEAVDNGRDFIFRDFNSAAEKMDGISRDELMGRRITELYPGIEEFGLLNVFRRVWQTGEPALHPLAHYQDKRIQAWRENRVYKLPSGEVVAVFEDMTRQKQVEEEKQAVEIRLQRAKKMEAIGLMAGGVAHDLNNILSGIIGYPELLLLQLPEGSDLRAPIKAIQESGERAAAVVADLLTVARGVAEARVVVGLNTLVTEYIDSPEYHHLRDLHSQVQFHIELADNLPDMYCSPIHIKKCIMNLVMNAAEAIETTGNVTLETASIVPDSQLAKKHDLKQTTYVVLTVTDTGSGIPGENINHIFEPFYTKKVMGRSGTGLGLAVVWNTVKEHKGAVTVTSNEQGTLFTLFFPAADTDIAKQIPSRKASIQGNGQKILIVDDEPHLLDIAGTMLKHLGYNVTCMNSGEEAVEYLKSRQADLVILDMLMEPGINGRQTYEQIIKIHPGQKAIIISGFSENEEVQAALRSGAGDFIKKPYSMEKLGLAVRQVLKMPSS